MCGRFGLQASWEELFHYFNLARPHTLKVEMPPRYNIPPTQPIVVVSIGADGQREGKLVRWGFVPAWVKNPKEFTLLANARSESAMEKPSFKNAIRHRRVLIPASGFFEWQRFGKGQPSQAYWVRSNSDPIVAFGGLMETWSGADGSEVDTACILTTAANDSFSRIHHRLPLVIHPQNFQRWLDCKTTTQQEVSELLTPVEDDYFEAIPVSDAVNKVSNAGPEIQNRVEPRTPAKEVQSPNEQLTMF